jgi:hypothetical protein
MATHTQVIRWAFLGLFVIAVTAATFWIAQRPHFDPNLKEYLEKAAVTLMDTASATLRLELKHLLR